jgi:hypothetical protein
MKKLTSLLTALVFASLIIFMSCGDNDPPPPPNPQQEILRQSAGLLIFSCFQ